mmetsp:Transcript_17142/g.47519  ORF Transcript_17142/g.47519 Transcript_17142/m.47519 type:complete len:512 (-) Transcript_17142:14-1549(-)
MFLLGCISLPFGTQRLRAVFDAAEDTCGKIRISGRYHCHPRRLETDYEVLPKVLGKGLTGVVRLGRNKHTDHECAVKSLELPFLPSEVDVDKTTAFASEVSIALAADHPHVARLEDVYQSTRRVHLVMEHLRGGTLFDCLKRGGRFDECKAAQVTFQMLLAVNYLHKRGIVHRDLKPANFIFQGPGSGEGALKLIDFGFSKYIEPGVPMDKCCGTVGYKAPEVLDRKYSSQCDLWSLGIIVFRLLMVQLPFSTEGTKAQVRARIRSGVIGIDRPKRWDALSDSARNFIERLLVVDPEQRMTAEQAFEHPWITGHNSPAPGPKLVDGTILEAFSSHARSTRLRRAFLHVAARSQIGHEVVSSVAAFTRMDSKHFGIIRLEALPDMLRDGCDLTQDQIGKLSHALDTFGTGEMNYSTFLAALLSSSLRPTSHIVKDAFRRLDADHSGYITGDDLRAVLGDSFEGAAVDTLLLDEQQLRRRGRMCFSEFAAILAPDQKVEEQPSEHEVNYKLEL